jgi:predicted metallopeptidase
MIDANVADVSARGFYEPIHVIEFIEKHFRFNLSRPLSDQDRIKVFVFNFILLVLSSELPFVFAILLYY